MFSYQIKREIGFVCLFNASNARYTHSWVVVKIICCSVKPLFHNCSRVYEVPLPVKIHESKLEYGISPSGVFLGLFKVLGSQSQVSAALRTIERDLT